jgi:hypothetical protein
MKTIISALFFAGVCFANSVQSRVSCTFAGATVTGSTACALSGADALGLPEYITASVDYPQMVSSGFDDVLTADASVDPGFGSIPKMGSANVLFSQTFGTTGPVRAGWAMVRASASSLPVPYSQLGSASLGSVSIPAVDGSRSCPCAFETIPFTLGMTFDATVQGTAAYNGSGQPDVAIGLSIEFQLFEDNGSGASGAAVFASPVPEPSTWIAMALGVGVLLFARRFTASR